MDKIKCKTENNSVVICILVWICILVFYPGMHKIALILKIQMCSLEISSLKKTVLNNSPRMIF
jgi:hypothetical protein